MHFVEKNAYNKMDLSKKLENNFKIHKSRQKRRKKVKKPKFPTKNKAIPGLISYLETTRQRHF